MRVVYFVLLFFFIFCLIYFFNVQYLHIMFTVIYCNYGVNELCPSIVIVLYSNKEKNIFTIKLYISSGPLGRKRGSSYLFHNKVRSWIEQFLKKIRKYSL